MTNTLKIILISTPIGYVGSGKGGGVELTIISLIKGLINLGHEVLLVAPEHSFLPDNCKAKVKHIKGTYQLSWQHQKHCSPVTIAGDGVLPRLCAEALELGNNADAVINFSYDWLPIWLTPYVDAKLFHLISMGAESDAMRNVIKDTFEINQSRFAFHTFRQAEDYSLSQKPVIVGNGFDLEKYNFKDTSKGPIGWAGRIAPEKGLEDAVSVAAALGEPLLVWGYKEDLNYSKKIEESFPPGTIDWRGFLSTSKLQEELGSCRALINTPKWNEAYGNVVVESLACGVPVVAYDKGGPGELIVSGKTGFLVQPDNINSLIESIHKIDEIDRKECRRWAERYASHDGFAKRIENWVLEGIHKGVTNN